MNRIATFMEVCAEAFAAVRWHRRARTEPYTAGGIKRVPCIRCGAPSVHQWQVCADKRRYRTLCLDCDIELNRLVLTWANDPDALTKVAAYETEQRSMSDLIAAHQVPQAKRMAQLCAEQRNVAK